MMECLFMSNSREPTVVDYSVTAILLYVFGNLAILSIADAIQIELSIFDVILTGLYYGRYVCK